MQLNMFVVLSAAGLLTASNASASDADPCAKDMVCASAPQSIVTALQKAGYAAELTKDSLGDPMISSAASGYKFSILFYGCAEHIKCDSLQFQVSFDPDKRVTMDYVNKWNSIKRFARASVNDKTEMDIRYDLATIGGLNQVNFRDVVDWWSSTLGDYAVYAKTDLK